MDTAVLLILLALQATAGPIARVAVRDRIAPRRAERAARSHRLLARVFTAVSSPLRRADEARRVLRSCERTRRTAGYRLARSAWTQALCEASLVVARTKA